MAKKQYKVTFLSHDDQEKPSVYYIWADSLAESYRLLVNATKVHYIFNPE
mgnify:CR=1 FL=1